MSILEEAAAVYAIEKPSGKHRVTMRIIAKRYRLRENQLRAYFANMQRNGKRSRKTG